MKTIVKASLVESFYPTFPKSPEVNDVDIDVDVHIDLRPSAINLAECTLELRIVDPLLSYF